MDENKLSTEFETYFTSAKQASTLSLQKGKNSAIIDGAQTITEEYPPVMLNQSPNDETSLLCNDCDCDSDCNHFNDMSTAINLSLNSWHSGEICCPGQEVWYKFTPTATTYYTFYTVGVLDTTGYLYDADGSQIDTDANNGTGTNFKIVAYLTAGETYYLKTTAFDNSTGSFSIAVTNTVFVDYISIDQSYVSLNKGETEALTVTVSPSYATNKNLYWTSSNTSVATVSQTGVVTATGAGTACICAHSQDGSNKSSCCEVSVDVPVESVTINISSLMLHVGECDDLNVEVCPTDAVNQLIRWSSSNASVVWVNEATGWVEARGVGTATIYATAQDGTGKRGTCIVTVEPPIAVQGIDICCDNYTMNVGETTYLSYDIYPSDATNQSVTWCSTNPSVATVDATTGRITAISAGTTTITVTTDDGSFVANCTVRVVIERVTIQKDGPFNKVIFESSGKVWKCVNCDTLYDEEYNEGSVEGRRTKYNFFTFYNEEDETFNDTTPREYTDDELKLLYAIDPYGVADYVKRYATAEFYNGDMLKSSIAYKDRIFRLLFRRDPEYFTRNLLGKWNRIIEPIDPDNVNWSTIISESDLLFGMHSIYDLTTLLEFISVVIDIGSILLGPVAPLLSGAIEAMEMMVKIRVIMLSTGESFVLNELASFVAGSIIEQAFDNTKLCWAYDLVSFSGDLAQLADSIAATPNYHREILNYCAHDTGYDVFVELENGMKHQIYDICAAINN